MKQYFCERCGVFMFSVSYPRKRGIAKKCKMCQREQHRLQSYLWTKFHSKKRAL